MYPSEQEGKKKLIGAKWRDPKLWHIATQAPDQFMSDASELVELMMHFIGRSTGPLRKIDADVEDLSEDAINGSKAFSYLRYNVEMSKENLDKLKIPGLNDEKMTDIMDMDLAENVEDLIRIGEESGAKEVRSEHLPKAFDLKSKVILSTTG